MDLNAKPEQTPGIGHNVDPFDVCAVRQKELVAAASSFLKEDHEITEDNEGAIADFIAQARANLKQIDEARVAERKPHLDANTAIQIKYATISDPLTKAVNTIKDKLTKFLQIKQRRIDEDRRQAEEEAQRKREAAEKLAAEAKPHDFQAQIDAEEAAKAADAAEKAAAKVPVNAGAKGAYGKTTSLRQRYAGTITDFAACLHHYRDEPWMREALERCIARDVNAKDKIHDIPGVTVKPVHSAQ